jgi:DNA polymerase I-like protein with 3'-5' exonuclease and polymerase domains
MLTWDDARVVAFDLETSGELPEYALQPWRLEQGKFWATSISVICHDGTQLTPFMSKLFPDRLDMANFLMNAIANKWTVVGWNLVYDISILIAYGLGDLVHQVKWLDGMLLWRHLFMEPEYEMDRSKKRSYRLKPDAINEFLPSMAGYNDDVDFHSTNPDELKKLQLYNDRDSVCTWLIAKIIWGRLTDEQRNAALIEANCLSLAAEANLNGMVVDAFHARELAAKLDKTAADMLEKLAPHGVTEKVVRSPVQLQKLMFDDWKLPVIKENTGKKTGKVSRSTDQEVLHELAFIDGRCRDLRSYREALNNRTKFAEAPLASASYNGDGRSRPAAIVFGTYSGRLTYSSKQGKNKDERQTGFALHQEKRGAEYRGIVVAPPGYTLMEFDAAGQEFRWMAIQSGDETMLQLCQPGEDPHSFMGAGIVSREYRELQKAAKTEDEQAFHDRFLGKFANLSCNFRVGAKKLRSTARTKHDLPMEMPQAQRIISIYKQNYRQVPRYWDRTIWQTKQRGYVETLAGRRVQVVGDWGGKDGWSLESTAVIYPIQGTGAEQKYLALQVLKPFLVEVGARFAWDLHDGIYLWVPNAMVERVAVEGKRLLDNLPYREAWGFTPPVPLPWDCKHGGGWGALKEWKS